MKTVCVFGAGGRTGRHVVDELLKSDNYRVVAGVYSLSHSFPENVTVKKCNITDKAEVSDILQGVDVVISVVGHIKGSDDFFQTEGTKNIVEAMKENGIRRIITLTGTGVRIPNDTPSVIDRILNILVGLIDTPRMLDGIAHVDVLKESGLDWTTLRVLKLTNNKRVSNIKLTEHGPAELFTSRRKVARILVRVIEDETQYQKLPVSS